MMIRSQFSDTDIKKIYFTLASFVYRRGSFPLRFFRAFPREPLLKSGCLCNRPLERIAVFWACSKTPLARTFGSMSQALGKAHYRQTFLKGVFSQSKD
jgi:hypothetical protein